MILEVTSFALLTTVVQSVVTSLGVDVYLSTDTECQTSLQFQELCNTTLCDQLTCDEIYEITPFVSAYPNRDECTLTQTRLGLFNLLLVCVDDGIAKAPCEDYDLCVDECYGGSGACVEPCIQYGLNMNNTGMGFDATGYADCGAICSANPYGFEYWGQCFNNSGRLRGTTLTCNVANSANTNCTMTSSSDDSNTGVIIGIVIGAVVVVGLIVAVVMYLKQSKNSL